MKHEQRGGKRNFWTAIDDQILRDGFDRLSMAELCRTLGRDPNAIGLRCRKLGIAAHGLAGAAALHQAWFGVAQ